MKYMKLYRYTRYNRRNIEEKEGREKYKNMEVYSKNMVGDGKIKYYIVYRNI